jgi:hypothetical protein
LRVDPVESSILTKEIGEKRPFGSLVAAACGANVPVCSQALPHGNESKRQQMALCRV